MLRSMHIYATKACDLAQLGICASVQTADAVVQWNGWDDEDDARSPT